MFLLGKTEKKHPGDLPPKAPDLPIHPHVTVLIYCSSIAVKYHIVTEIL